MVDVDQPERIERTALAVRAHLRRIAAGQVGLHQRPALRQVPAVDDAQARGGAELGQVCSARQPFQVLAANRRRRPQPTAAAPPRPSSTQSVAE